MGKSRRILQWLKKNHSTVSLRGARPIDRDDTNSSRSSMSRKNSERSNESRKNSGASNESLEKQNMQIAATVSLIEQHLSSRKEEPPQWDQEFSSMSSCRSDGDLNKVLASRQIVIKSEDEAEEHHEIPPILRNPDVPLFDIVDDDDELEEEETDGKSQGTGCEFKSELGAEFETELDDGTSLTSLTSLTRPDVSPLGSSKSRRKQYSDSFSASLPTEIKGVVSESIPLVKQSYEPYMDFRISMREMIREKELHVWSDLEELLYCYLSLNSPEQHGVIKQAFADVWHELGLALPVED